MRSRSLTFAMGRAKFSFMIERWRILKVGGLAMAQIGQPVRRYTVIPLEEPVSPTAEPVIPLPPSKSPDKAPPVTKPEPQPAR